MLENSKKNKRGARGSTDDDVNKAKRPFKTSENMADKNSKGPEAEPTLSNLKTLQGLVNTILKDNKSLKDEISAIKTSFNAQGGKFNKLKETVDKIEKENKSLKGELLRTKVKMEEQRRRNR